jgi:hypothetical protein
MAKGKYGSSFGEETDIDIGTKVNIKKNSMVWVRVRTIPTKRPLLVGEDCQLLWIEVPRGLRDGSLRPYSPFYTQELLLLYQVAPQLYSRG